MENREREREGGGPAAEGFSGEGGEGREGKWLLQLASDHV